MRRWGSGLKIGARGSFSISRDHLVGDARHARYAFGERQKRLVLLRRADQSPQMNNPATDDHVALAEIGPVFLAQSVQQLVANLAVGLATRAGGGCPR